MTYNNVTNFERLNTACSPCLIAQCYKLHEAFFSSPPPPLIFLPIQTLSKPPSPYYVCQGISYLSSHRLSLFVFLSYLFETAGDTNVPSAVLQLFYLGYCMKFIKINTRYQDTDVFES